MNKTLWIVMGLLMCMGCRSETAEVKEKLQTSGSTVQVFRQDEMFGLKNAQGKVILPAEYAKVRLRDSWQAEGCEVAFWHKEKMTPGDPADGTLMFDRGYLLLCRNNRFGLFSADGTELLPIEYEEILPIHLADSYAVISDDGSFDIWKDGSFILQMKGNHFYGVDAQKRCYVFSNKRGRVWDFYGFDGKTHQRLVLPKPAPVCFVPQWLGDNRFWVDYTIVDQRGTELVKMPEMTEVCGDFLIVPSEDCREFDVFFSDGKLFVSGVSMAYPVASTEVPHLPTGDIIIDRDGKLLVYDRLGNFLQEVDQITPVGAFSQVEPAKGSVLFFADFE